MSHQLELFAPPAFKTTIAKCGTPVAIGNEVPIDDVRIFGLSPGSKITQIGQYAASGGITSSHRVDRFDPPVVYAGVLEAISFNEECNARYLAFLDQTQEIPTYLLYMFADENDCSYDELFVYNFKSQSPRFYDIFFGRE